MEAVGMAVFLKIRRKLLDGILLEFLLNFKNRKQKLLGFSL